MHVIVMVTCPEGRSAEKVAGAVLGKRLAACVNTVPGMTSRYWWRGKIERSSEVLLIMKTRGSLVKKLENAVKENHPYDVPEVIAIPITAGSKGYLDWIDSETG